MDRLWWNTYAHELRETAAEFWTTSREAARVYRMNLIVGQVGVGVMKQGNAIYLGGNSGYQAVGLALHFGARRVILLGYDMQATGGRTHWHGNHAKLGNPLPDRYPEWRRQFSAMNRELPEGVEIVNATRESALTSFARMPIEQALALVSRSKAKVQDLQDLQEQTEDAGATA
jgi:hypothetical protein